MSNNRGALTAPRAVLLTGSLLAVAALALPWFAQYDEAVADPRLRGHEWSGWGLAAESAYDGRALLGLLPTALLVLATVALAAVAVIVIDTRRARPLALAAAGLAAVLLAVSLWLGSSATGLRGDGHLVGTLFGLAVWRIGLLACLLGGAWSVLEIDAAGERAAAARV